MNVTAFKRAEPSQAGLDRGPCEARILRQEPRGTRRPTRLSLRLLLACPHPALWKTLGNSKWRLSLAVGLTVHPSPSRRTPPEGCPHLPPNFSPQTLWTCGLATFLNSGRQNRIARPGAGASRRGRLRSSGTECKGCAPAGGRRRGGAVPRAGCTGSSRRLRYGSKAQRRRGQWFPRMCSSSRRKGAGRDRARCAESGSNARVLGPVGRWGTHLQSPPPRARSALEE